MSVSSIVGSLAMPAGGAAVIHVASAPLEPGEGMRLSWFLEGAFGADEKPDVFVTTAAKGLLEDTAENWFAWAEIEGAIIATAWTMTPAGEPRIGTMGEVYTDPALRGRGLAPAVCAALLERFDAAGGQLMFLATGNPSAARIYARLGFLPYPRGLMRRDGTVAAEAFDEAWFARSTVAIRPVRWGDTPRIVALYSAPNPWLSACWMQGLYSPSFVTHDRCNSLVKHTWQATRAGAWLAIVNDEGAIVGSGPMEPHGNEKAVLGADMDLFVHPAFEPDADVLLAAMVNEARARGWRWLRAEVGEADAAKRGRLEANGFREVVRLKESLEVGGTRQDVSVLIATV